MVFGLGAGIGFFYLRSYATSPSRMFQGRTLSFESDFFANAGIPFEDRPEADDERAWQAVRERLDAGEPVLIATDTFYLGYHATTSHFPMHRAVVVGYDDATRQVFMADRKFPELQTASFEELARARNAPDYPMTCHNQFGAFLGPVRVGADLPQAVRAAMRQAADWMLAPAGDDPMMRTGVDAMRGLARDFPGWRDAADWSWAARFGYQVVIRRGAGGSFFRSIYADFLTEAATHVPAVGEAGLAGEMHDIAAGWRALAGTLEEQSEREECDPALFESAGAQTAALADREEAFFRRLREAAAA